MQRFALCLAVLLVGGFAAASEENQEEQTFTDPAKAGPDYQVQGEYVQAEKGGENHAAQVIALGGGKFTLVHTTGGLPGEDWERGGFREEVAGETKDGVTIFEAKDWIGKLKDGVIEVTDKEGNSFGQLKRIVRKSSTEGAKPPEGATVLFDGKSAEAFERGQITMEELLASDCETKEKFGDHTLHIEFMTPFKPYARGQARGNSGVYAQGRYEIQVLDSFGLSGENNECGGIYSIAQPDVNMCYPPLTWQTYDIDFTAAKYEGDKKVENGRITIKHNGVVIHDDLELPKGTPGKIDEGPGPGQLYLQGHGNPVVYRNIWVVKK